MAGGLGSVWVLAFTLSLLELQQPSSSPFFLDPAESVEAPPRVRAFADWADAEDHPVRIGDGILRVDGHDMRGRGPLAYRFFKSGAAGRDPRRVEMTLLRGGRELEVVVDTSLPSPHYAPLLATSLVHAVVALLILVRSPSVTAVRPMFLAFMFYALSFAWYFNGPVPVAAFGVAVAATGSLLAHPLMVRAFLGFPAEAGSLRGVHRIWPWLFVPLGIFSLSYNIGTPLAPDQARGPLVVGTFVYICAMAVIATVNYRRVGALGRRQIRWMVFGVYVAALPALFSFAWLAVWPDTVGLWWAVSLGGATILYPITMLIAISRSDLFDIDRVFGSLLTYNILVVVVLGVGIFVAPYATNRIFAAAEVERFLSQLVVTLVLAWLLVQGYRRLRPWVDRVAFPERFALQHGVDRLLADLEGASSPELLLECAGRSLVDLCGPRTVVIYWRRTGVYQAVFARGSVIPPVFPAGRATAEILALRRAVDIKDLSRGEMGAMERASLENLAAEVAVPVVHAGRLAAIALLGEKRSGDIYTPSELALLGAVGASLSSQLDRFDRQDVLARTQQMQQALQRYVPRAVTQQLTGGGSLDAGEQHVSVLFVDMRGFTSFAAGRAAADVFSTVDRYTGIVSRVVNAHEGAVVEFNGDGMMAVFGAPSPLGDKEKAALLAGLGILTEVSALPAARQRPDVGVGIATGTAFVGTISAVDRSIWTVIGDPPNRASRLQTLTRTLDCSLLVDGTTRAGAGAAADMLADMGVHAIRGFQREEQLFGIR